MPNARVPVQVNSIYGGWRIADNAAVTIYVDHGKETSDIAAFPVPPRGAGGSTLFWARVAAALDNSRWRLVPNSHEVGPRRDLCHYFSVEEAS